MARRAPAQSTLFPFMSVLACTIGALIVLLAVLSMAAVGATGAVEEAVAARAESRAVERARRIAQVDGLERAEATWARVDEALAERGLDAGASAQAILARVETVRARQAETTDRARLERALAQVESDREGVETTIEVLENRRETLPILIDPTGLAPHRRPYFVECDAGGVTAHPTGEGPSYFIPREELASSRAWQRYLRRVRAEPSALVVLLIRPDGLDTARLAKRRADAAGVRVARLPLPGTGALDWRLLRGTGSGEKDAARAAPVGR